ncbi:hypothetical protein OG422_17380 [Streptomyces sp. NBC_01525]|nr:hypothetical protein [Streptomyces benahoarensis]
MITVFNKLPGVATAARYAVRRAALKAVTLSAHAPRGERRPDDRATPW